MPNVDFLHPQIQSESGFSTKVVNGGRVVERAAKIKILLKHPLS